MIRQNRGIERRLPPLRWNQADARQKKKSAAGKERTAACGAPDFRLEETEIY
jgi:hypothetical protein